MAEKLFATFYVQNEDRPELNDVSDVEYLDGVLTLSCNDDHKSFLVTGPPPTKERLDALEKHCGDYPVCPDDPQDVVEFLGLVLGEETTLPENSGLQPPTF